MTAKERLHQLIETLPEHSFAAAERLLEDLRSDAGQEDEHGMTAEDRAWMDADLSHLGEHEPNDWGDEGPPKGLPIRYVPGKSLMILDDEEEDAVP